MSLEMLPSPFVWSDVFSSYTSDSSFEYNSFDDSNYSFYTPNQDVWNHSVISQDETEFKDFSESWKVKSVKSWTIWDTLGWLASLALDLNIDYEDITLSYAGFDGKHLSTLSECDFKCYSKDYGTYVYSSLQRILDSEENNTIEVDKQVLFDLPEERTFIDLNLQPAISENQNHEIQNREFLIEKLENLEIKKEEETLVNKLEKKRPGRPKGSKRRIKNEKLGRLWEFIRDLLKNPEYCPSLIVWENHDEGMFKFVHSDKVAKLWGSKKGNPDMNYEKLSRAMRYYYRNKVLQPVIGRRLVYKFGPNATGWRVNNPNFVHP